MNILHTHTVTTRAVSCHTEQVTQGEVTTGEVTQEEAGSITTTTTMDTVTMAMGVRIPPEGCTIATGKL